MTCRACLWAETGNTVILGKITYLLLSRLNPQISMLILVFLQYLGSVGDQTSDFNASYWTTDLRATFNLGCLCCSRFRPL